MNSPKVNLFALVAAGLPGYLLLGAMDVGMTDSAHRALSVRDQPQTFSQSPMVLERIVVTGKREPKQRLAHVGVRVPALR